MSDVSTKTLGIASAALVEEQVEQQPHTMRLAGLAYFEQIRETMARNALFAALLGFSGPKQADPSVGSSVGYLTDTLKMVASSGTITITSTDVLYDDEGYAAGYLPPRAASGNVLGEPGALFNERDDAGTQLDAIPFEDTISVTYYVGIACATYPTESVANPRTGVYEYTTEKTVLGVKCFPDLVTDLGGSLIKLRIANADALAGGPGSLAGRSAIVYLHTGPQGSTATAIATAVVTWDGTNNNVTVSYLGQVTPSTTVGDYRIVILGPVITRTDVSVFDGIAYVGTMLNGTPSVDAQNSIPTSLKLIQDILEVGRPSTNTAQQNVWKVIVKAKAGESEVTQLGVKDSGGSPVFTVDEDGDMVANDAILADITGDTFNRAVAYTPTYRHSVRKWYYVCQFGSGGSGTYSFAAATAGQPDYWYNSGALGTDLTWVIPLEIPIGAKVTSVGVYGYQTATGGGVVSAKLRTFDLDDTGIGTIHHTHTHSDTSGAFVDSSSALGTPKELVGGINERLVLECGLLNNADGAGSVRLSYAYIDLELPIGLDLAQEHPVGA